MQLRVSVQWRCDVSPTHSLPSPPDSNQQLPHRSDQSNARTRGGSGGARRGTGAVLGRLRADTQLTHSPHRSTLSAESSLLTVSTHEEKPAATHSEEQRGIVKFEARVDDAVPATSQGRRCSQSAVALFLSRAPARCVLLVSPCSSLLLLPVLCFTPLRRRLPHCARARFWSGRIDRSALGEQSSGGIGPDKRRLHHPHPDRRDRPLTEATSGRARQARRAQARALG